MFQHVFVALKEDSDPRPLIELAVEVAAPAARVHLVTLIRVGKNEDELQRLKGTEQWLADEANRLRKQGYDATYEVGGVAVAAAVELAEMAARRDVDLMVIGLAKRSRVGKALLGSDAQRLLLSSRCPVLVTHLFGS